MIITCNNCNKKFDINSELIPEKGRLLQCGSCSYKWFFKNNVISTKENDIDINDNLISDRKTAEDKNKKDLIIEKQSLPKETEKFIIEAESALNIKKKDSKNNKILSFIFVLIISFLALIILVDTFKYPISKIIPNIELILYNLYETFKDIELFLRDLI
jgi:predicted Zn finger-like uncharacterized protein